MLQEKEHPLRSERRRRNLSQQMLADFAELSLSTIIRAERGQPISAHARQRICEYLGKSSVELGLVPLTISGPERGAEVSLAPLRDREEDTGMDRREAIKLLGLAGASIVLESHELLTPEPWERLSRALRKSTYVDSAAVEQLESITASYWRLRDASAPKDVLAGVSAHLGTFTRLLQDAPASKVRVKLCSAAGRASLVAGQLSFDLNDYASARAYYRTAVQAAGEAEDHGLAAVALGRAAFTYTEAGQAENALTLAKEGQAHAAKKSNPVERSWLDAIGAEAYAHLREASLCQKAMDVAAATVASVPSEADRYWTGFNASRLADYRGACYVKIGEPLKALEALSEVEATGESWSPLRRSRRLTDMAAAYLQLGEVEEACRLASESLAMARAVHSVTVIPRLKKVRQGLEPWRDTATVREFDAQLLLL